MDKRCRSRRCNTAAGANDAPCAQHNDNESNCGGQDDGTGSFCVYTQAMFVTNTVYHIL